MFNDETFRPIAAPELPTVESCLFYHTMTFSDGITVVGPWDIRGKFAQYIGNYDVAGKTVLDVGTASGFLAFAAEQAGATVTALDFKDASELDQIHFAGLAYHEDRQASDAAMQQWSLTLKNGFWYCWHKNQSKAEVVYAPLRSLPYWKRRFDVVLAGAILEHLADPVSALWSLTQLATEAVVVAFTPVDLAEGQFMTTANPWDNPVSNYTWWTLSEGLYRRIFDSVGFDMALTSSSAITGGISHSRPTIIATRRSSIS